MAVPPKFNALDVGRNIQCSDGILNTDNAVWWTAKTTKMYSKSSKISKIGVVELLIARVRY
jgi:hypothetical protein